MDTTIFLAQLWGPVILAAGVGMFVSREQYIKAYRDVGKDAMAGLVFGMAAMAAGIAQVLFHNTWEGLLEVIISLLGWGILIKGALFLIAPRFVDQMGDRWIKAKILPAAGGLMILIGGYLTWISYLA